MSGECWQPTAGPVITDPNSAEGAIRIYRDLAQEANGRAFVLERGGVPLGFNSRQEFQSFGWDTRNALVRSGNADAEPFLRGSAVTGYSYTSGAAFDSRTRSDYDFAIVSGRLFDKARDLGIPLIGRGSRTWPLTPVQMRRLGIDGVNDFLGTSTRRDTSIVIFRDVDALRSRGPNLQLP